MIQSEGVIFFFRLSCVVVVFVFQFGFYCYRCKKKVAKMCYVYLFAFVLKRHIFLSPSCAIFSDRFCLFLMEKIGILNSRWRFFILSLSLFIFNCLVVRFANQAKCIFSVICRLNKCIGWCWPCYGHIFASLQWIWLMIMSEMKKWTTKQAKIAFVLCFRSLYFLFCLFIKNFYEIFNNGASSATQPWLWFATTALRYLFCWKLIRCNFSIRFGWLIDKIHMPSKLNKNGKNTISFTVIESLTT